LPLEKDHVAFFFVGSNQLELITIPSCPPPIMSSHMVKRTRVPDEKGDDAKTKRQRKSWQGMTLRFPSQGRPEFDTALSDDLDLPEQRGGHRGRTRGSSWASSRAATKPGVTKLDEEDETGGEWEQDETDANEGAALSWLKDVTADQNLQFLAKPPISRGDSLRRMSLVERMIFAFIVLLSPIDLLARIWSLPQKSDAWKWARTGRITGSSTGACVGQQRQTRVKKVAYSAVYLKFKGNAATQWGSGKEVYATKCYANDLQRLVTETFRKQRRSGTIQATATEEGKMHFVFRNQQIPVLDLDADPSVEIRHYGLMIDPWNHWRGVSPDGVIFINNTPCGVLEAKCAFSMLHPHTSHPPFRLFYSCFCDVCVCACVQMHIREQVFALHKRATILLQSATV
jgi:hypothetical protein